MRRYFCLLLLLFGVVGCQNEGQTAVETVVVTEMVDIAGTPQVATRIITRTIEIMATPEPTRVEVRQPVVLDLAAVRPFARGIPDIDPQTTSDEQGINLVENLFTSLTRYNPESTFVEPEFATDWQVSADGRTWTFNLRSDVYWVRPSTQPRVDLPLEDVAVVRAVTADDVVFAVERACQQETNTPNIWLLFIIVGCEQLNEIAEPTPADFSTLGVRALDPQTVQFTLNKPASYFLTMTSLPMLYPVPRDRIVQHEADWVDTRFLLTSGPYFPTSTGLLETRLTLNKNPLFPIQRQGNVDAINILLLSDELDAFELWDARSLDVSLVPNVLRDEVLETETNKTLFFTDQTVFYVGFNLNSGVFRESTARRAFSAAINREELLEILDITGEPMRHLTPPGVFGSPPIDQVGVGFSPDFAAQQLSGTSFAGCRNIENVTIQISSIDLSLQIIETLQDMWRERLGCLPEQFVIEQVQFGTLLANTRSNAGANRPDMWELGWASYFPDAHNWLYDLLHCTDSENRPNRSCNEIDDLLREATLTIDPVQRVQLYREVENRLFGGEGSFPIAPLYVTGQYWVRQSWLTFTPASFGGEQYDTYIVDAELKELERSRR